MKTLFACWLILLEPAASLARASARRLPPPPLPPPLPMLRRASTPTALLPADASRHLVCLFGAFTSVTASEALTAQAMPRMFVEMQPATASNAISAVSAAQAGLELLTLPLLAAASDAAGRRRIMVAVSSVTVFSHLMVVASPSLPLVVLNKLVCSCLSNVFLLLTSISCYDLFWKDSSSMAALEGRSAACWGIAFAVGMLLGGCLLQSAAPLSGSRALLRRAYACSSGLAAGAAALSAGTRETLLSVSRRPFKLRECVPGGNFRVFGSSRLLTMLGLILCLQTLHDGEGDVWQVYNSDLRGWTTRENSVYGALVGSFTTVGGLFVGLSVRTWGPLLHSLLCTLSTMVANLVFMSRSGSLAYGSTPLRAVEDCMSAAVIVAIVQRGTSAGFPRGMVASSCHNLTAMVRMCGLFSFGRLYAVGRRCGLPQLPYLMTAAAQLLACLLLISPQMTGAWESSQDGEGAVVSSDEESVETRVYSD